ncbi:hypothetical protein CEXT_748121 [Caerostris extrusa]|uniref:Uncharacterized protein n=1 Tax=Caerostris extrusa TaxID=172846 RepID=A0AAV4QRQ1_CAEEX|nr:hypothetical protein CEXT_748121 [Caerostris extrusa]
MLRNPFLRSHNNERKVLFYQGCRNGFWDDSCLHPLLFTPTPISLENDPQWIISTRGILKSTEKYRLEVRFYSKLPPAVRILLAVSPNVPATGMNKQRWQPDPLGGIAGHVDPLVPSDL